MLSDTIDGAEKVFNEFKGMLNGIAYTYSVSTGVEKADLFGEAVIGLSKAISHYDPSYGASLRTYAAKVIRSVLNDYVRKNIYTVFVPPYIKRANKVIRFMKTILFRTGMDKQAINEIVRRGDISIVPQPIQHKCLKLIELISKEAERASIDYCTLVNRSEYIPLDVEISDEVMEDKQSVNDREQELDSAMLVSHLKSNMDQVELSIANGIMIGKTYEEIAMEHGKTKAWVRQKLNKFRDKIDKRMKEK